MVIQGLSLCPSSRVFADAEIAMVVKNYLWMGEFPIPLSTDVEVNIHLSREMARASCTPLAEYPWVPKLYVIQGWAEFLKMCNRSLKCG